MMNASKVRKVYPPPVIRTNMPIMTGILVVIPKVNASVLRTTRKNLLRPAWWRRQNLARNKPLALLMANAPINIPKSAIQIQKSFTLNPRGKLKT